MTAEQRQVTAVRRRLAETTFKGLLDRMMLHTMLRPVERGEMLDALVRVAADPDPVACVLECWQRWRLVMADHESFATYARRNLRPRR